MPGALQAVCSSGGKVSIAAMAIWNPDVETLPRDRMEALQLDRLRACVTRVLAAVPPLAARLRDAGLADARDLRSLADLRPTAVTTKTDPRETHPFLLRLR